MPIVKLLVSDTYGLDRANMLIVISPGVVDMTVSSLLEFGYR